MFWGRFNHINALATACLGLAAVCCLNPVKAELNIDTKPSLVVETVEQALKQPPNPKAILKVTRTKIEREGENTYVSFLAFRKGPARAPIMTSERILIGKKTAEALDKILNIQKGESLYSLPTQSMEGVRPFFELTGQVKVVIDENAQILFLFAEGARLAQEGQEPKLDWYDLRQIRNGLEARDSKTKLRPIEFLTAGGTEVGRGLYVPPSSPLQKPYVILQYADGQTTKDVYALFDQPLSPSLWEKPGEKLALEFRENEWGGLHVLAKVGGGSNQEPIGGELYDALPEEVFKPDSEVGVSRLNSLPEGAHRLPVGATVYVKRDVNDVEIVSSPHREVSFLFEKGGEVYLRYLLPLEERFHQIKLDENQKKKMEPFLNLQTEEDTAEELWLNTGRNMVKFHNQLAFYVSEEGKLLGSAARFHPGTIPDGENRDGTVRKSQYMIDEIRSFSLGRIQPFLERRSGDDVGFAVNLKKGNGIRHALLLPSKTNPQEALLKIYLPGKPGKHGKDYSILIGGDTVENAIKRHAYSREAISITYDDAGEDVQGMKIQVGDAPAEPVERVVLRSTMLHPGHELTSDGFKGLPITMKKTKALWDFKGGPPEDFGPADIIIEELPETVPPAPKKYSMPPRQKAGCSKWFRDLNVQGVDPSLN